jgi:hypothetical protein
LGCVYVIGIEGSSLVKIGYTSQAATQRLKALQTGMPFRLKLLKVYPCEQVDIVERRMHRLLHAHRGTGEWFDTNIAALDDIFQQASTMAEPDVGQPSIADERQHQKWRYAASVLGNRVRFRRLELEMSQGTLAESVGVHVNTIARLEHSAGTRSCQRRASATAYHGALAWQSPPGRGARQGPRHGSVPECGDNSQPWRGALRR